jgi:hypothetical protein
MNAVDSLTILEENKLRVENQRVREDKNSLEKEKEELNILRKQLVPLLELKTTLIKEGILKEINNQ